MTEIRTNHWTDNSIQSAAMRNAAERAQVAEIQDMMMYLLWGDEIPAGSAGGVMGGLEVTRVSGQLQSTVSPGWGWFYDSALTAPRSKFGVLILKEAVTVNHSAGDATHPRIDIITITCPTGTDTNLSVPFWQAAPQNIDTQRGAQPSVVVTEGTPSSSPVMPSVPAGHRLLASVQVPAGATNLDGATYTDQRILRGVQQRDGTTNPLTYRQRSVLSSYVLAELRGPGIAAGNGSKIRWSQLEDWPTFRRSTSGAGENASDDLYPMLIPSGRTWWRMCSWFGYAPANTGPTGLGVQRDMTTGGVRYTRTGSGPNNGDEGDVVSVPVEARGLEVVGAKFRYDVTVAFNGSPFGTPIVELWHIAANGALTKVADGTIDLGTVSPGSEPAELTLTMNATPVVNEGDALFARFRFSYPSATSGEIIVYSISVQFREGRTS